MGYAHSKNGTDLLVRYDVANDKKYFLESVGKIVEAK